MTENDASIDAEPVDAEFEPAPSDTSGRPRAAGLAIWIPVLAITLLATAAMTFFLSRNDAVPLTLQSEDAAERTSPDTSSDELANRVEVLEDSLRSLSDMSDRLTAMTERVGVLESGIERTERLSRRLAAAESALADLPRPASGDETDTMVAAEQRLDALEQESNRHSQLIDQALDAVTTVTANTVDPAWVADINARLTALEAVDPVVPADTTALENQLTARLERLEAQLAVLDARVVDASRDEVAPGDPAIRQDRSLHLASRALAFAALHEAAGQGESFEAERLALLRHWQDNRDLAALAVFAPDGVPTRAELRDSFPLTEILDTEPTRRVFFGLIETRPVAPGTEGASVGELARLVDQKLAESDLAAAVTLAGALPPTAQDVAATWLVNARARLELEQILTRIRAALTGALAEQESDPS
ncbi:COG4223 family protein [Maricaulis sp. CAU 1757]